MTHHLKLTFCLTIFLSCIFSTLTMKLHSYQACCPSCYSYPCNCSNPYDSQCCCQPCCCWEECCEPCYVPYPVYYQPCYGYGYQQCRCCSKILPGILTAIATAAVIVAIAIQTSEDSHSHGHTTEEMVQN